MFFLVIVALVLPTILFVPICLLYNIDQWRARLRAQHNLNLEDDWLDEVN